MCSAGSYTLPHWELSRCFCALKGSLQAGHLVQADLLGDARTPQIMAINIRRPEIGAGGYSGPAQTGDGGGAGHPALPPRKAPGVQVSLNPYASLGGRVDHKGPRLGAPSRAGSGQGPGGLSFQAHSWGPLCWSPKSRGC